MDIKKIVKGINKKHFFKRLLIFILGLLISAISFNLLEFPSQIVTGGSTGISILTDYFFGIKPADIILWISIGALIMSFIFLDLEQSLGALIATFVFPFFVDLTSTITNYIVIDMSDMLLISIFLGVLSGISTGLIYKSGMSAGGTSVISHILYKYFKISRSTSSFAYNGILVIIGGFVFGWSKVMYAIIVLYIYSVISDRVLLGISKNKNVYIISLKYQEIKDYIMNELHCGLTEFDVKGGLSFKKKKVLMTAVANNDYFILKEGVKHIDSDSFLIVTDSYQVSGGK